MWQKFWYKLNNTVTGGALIIAFFSFLAKLFGFLRVRLIAHNFGAGELSDVYYAAFRLPDLIFNTLVLGALTAAFIPVFQRVWHRDKEEGLILANSILNFFLIVVGILVVVFVALADKIMPYLTPGFSALQLEQVVSLTRIMLVAILFFVVSNVIGGVLNSWKKFFSFSLAASLYNIGIIIGIVLFYDWWGLIGLAYGVLFGALLHLLVQLPEVIKNGWRYRPVLYFDKNLKRILKLMIPRTIGLAANQINLLVITMIASTLAVGSIAIFNLANDLQSLPISLFGVSLAVAVFPTFTQAASEKNSHMFVHNFSLSFRRILFLLVPISAFVVVLRAQLVRVLLGTGAFNWQDTYLTAQTLGFFALSIFAQGLIPILARSFYAYENTKTPMVISVFSIFLNIILSWKLSASMGVTGLALAFSIASVLNMILLYISLSFKVKEIDHEKIFNSLIKISVNTVLAAFVIYLGLNIMDDLVNMRTFWGIFTQGLVAGLAGLLTYLILSILFRLEEVDIIKRIIKKTLLLFKNGRN